MRHLDLRHRLLVLTLLPSALIALILVLYFTISGVRSLEEQMHIKGLATVRHLAPVSEYAIIAGQQDGLHALVQATIQEPGVKAVVIVNSKGRTLAVSGRVSLAADSLRNRVEHPRLVGESERWLAFGAPVLRTQNETDPLFDLASSGQPVPEIIGMIFVEFDKSELSNHKREFLTRGLIVVGIGLTLMALLAIRMADHLAKPLTRLAQAVNAMSSGLFSTRVPVVSHAELRQLEAGFNEMAEHIEDMQHSMQSRIEAATAQLVFHASHDALTGLLNRREFELRLEKVLDTIQAGGEEASMLFVDLDRFKPVNDTCGHLAGDELLRQIGQFFAGRLRETDTLARLGGDEFGILLANCNHDRARQVAHDLCQLSNDYRFIWQDKIFSIGASIGLTPITRQVHNVQEIIGASDAACQRAKEQGRNQVCEAEASSPPERRQNQGNWSSRLAEALLDGRLMLEALPVRRLNREVPDGDIAELSARLNEPGQPPIAMSALIDAAERYELANQFDQHFVDTGIRAMARATRAGRAMKCLVPLSRNALENSATSDYIGRRLREEGVAGKGLCLMFPEDVTVRQSGQIVEFSRHMQRLGCQIALTEFGSGLSSFHHLRALSPAYIKLSPGLTRDIVDNRTSTALLKAILEITAAQNVYAIADGIDDLSQRDSLATLGVSYAQGQVIAPREPFDAWLEGAILRGAN
ncbi:MAG: diguanylate cyclase [Dechloromonas sp.]|nr:diguanylate cyclase [Dechloromonas sp.]